MIRLLWILQLVGATLLTFAITQNPVHPLRISAAAMMLGLSGLGLAPRRQRRPWCIHRENGHVRFHRRSDPQMVAQLERELEIGPEGVKACAARLEREAHARENAAATERFLSGAATIEDHKNRIAGVFTMPAPQVGRRHQEAEFAYISKKLWQDLYTGNASGVVFPHGWKLARLNPDEQTVMLVEDWTAPPPADLDYL